MSQIIQIGDICADNSTVTIRQSQSGIPKPEVPPNVIQIHNPLPIWAVFELMGLVLCVIGAAFWYLLLVIFDVE